MIYVTSDLHGFPHRDFLSFLSSAGFRECDTLYVLGDVIDRNGDGGVETLRWLRRQPNARLLLGNHEQMLLSCAFLFEEVTEKLADGLTESMLTSALIWSQNGSAPTIESLAFLRRTNLGEFAALLEYVREAPLYRRVSTSGGEFLLTHAGLGDFSPEKPLASYDPHDLLWHRPKPSDRYFENVTTVFGHTPTEYYGVHDGRMKRTDTWIDIDTGAAGGGAPMLLRLDDLREFYWN